MNLFKFPALAGLSTLLISCSAAGVLNGITPSSSFDRDKNVAYGDGPRQMMDIYHADEPKADAPVIIFVHGGGWNAGDKSMYKFVAEGFTKDGFDVVVPNYRLWPDMVYPEMVMDTAAAVKDVSMRYPGRPLVLMGHSAGAYNVLQTVVAPDVSGVDACANVSGVVALAAPTGVYPLKEEPYISIFADDRLTGDDGPANRTPIRSPALFLVNGLDDKTVRPTNATIMADRYRALGLRAEAKTYDGMGHVDAVRVLSRHFDGDSSLKADILRFIDGLPSGPDYCRS
ncbi:MAG: alpha/beta hydrolase [Litorimonas sp.]